MTEALILFPDIEALVIAVVNADFATSFTGVTASTKNQGADEYLKVTRTGGPRETLISERAQLLLEAYSPSEVRAIAILGRARALLFAQAGTIFGVNEISGPANLPDPLTSQIRYTQLLGVRTRGTVSAP